MSLISEWLGSDELFELNEFGIISYIEKKIEFINIFEVSRHSIASGYEKKLIYKAKNHFYYILNMIEGSEQVYSLSDEECEEIMKENYEIMKNIIEFIEFEFLN